MKVRSEPCLFTEREAVFLCRGGLARVATVSQDGQPHVVPVAFEFDDFEVEIQESDGT